MVRLKNKGFMAIFVKVLVAVGHKIIAVTIYNKILEDDFLAFGRQLEGYLR